MNLPAKKIMPLLVNCREFSALAYGLINNSDFYTSYSQDDGLTKHSKAYDRFFDEINSSKTNPLIIQTVDSRKVDSIDRLTKVLEIELDKHPIFHTRSNDDRPQEFTFKLPPDMIKDGKLSMDTQLCWGDESSIETGIMHFNFKKSKWPFSLLLSVFISEIYTDSADCHEFEEWLVTYINNNFDVDIPYNTQEKRILNTKNITAQVQTQAETNTLSLQEKPINHDSFDNRITNTEIWQNLYGHTKKIIDLFPDWRESQNKPNNIPKNKIDDWLNAELKITKRESEIIKKILIEIYNL